MKISDFVRFCAHDYRFCRVAIFAIVAFGVPFIGPARAVVAEEKADAADKTFHDEIRPLLGKFCFDCHGADLEEAEIQLERFSSLAEVRKDSDTWEKVAEMLDFGAMPPEDEAQPSTAERKRLVRWIKETFSVDCQLKNDPGRVTIRRLNRSEYDNTLRDLIGLDLNLAKDFPSDDVGEGFDNIGDVLSMPPLLFEKYLDAAEQIAESAIVDVASLAISQNLQRDQLKGLGSAKLSSYGVYALPSAGLVTGSFSLPRDGEYLFRVEAGAQQAGPELAKLELSLDGKKIDVVDVKAPPDQMGIYEVRMQAAKGAARFSAAFINDYYRPDAKDPKDRDRNMYIRSLEVFGPVDRQQAELPESHRRIVIAVPDENQTVQQAAGTVLRRFASRAFRRPVTEEELNGLVGLVELAVDNGDSFERGIQVAMTATLVSTHFLFREELNDTPNDAAGVRELNDFELASRLSYFLWSSMPDDELFRLARDGKLRDDQVLREQVHRMLQDKKARALVENFGGQWLNLRNLADVTPDQEKFPQFNEALRRDMLRETGLVFAAIMREDRSILEFLTADFTFVNERLAAHYGITGVEGDEFRRVTLPPQQRTGILTHASVLTLTSYPTRTSPVQRGKWVMENLLGSPPPEPPANVPTLEETQQASPNLSLREQFVLHRSNPVCASCHKTMDALGFGLENFDAIGRWREKDGRFPIDASGKLPEGDQFSGPAELARVLEKRKSQFSRALTKKMLTFALGRGLTYQDDCFVDKIEEYLVENDYRFSALVLGIVNSDPFQKRRGEGVKQ